jgi:uncharacterized membrane protein YbhN (UPF0104 family)
MGVHRSQLHVGHDCRLGVHVPSWTVIFATFAVVMTVSAIPIINLPGITGVILISTLSQYAGSEDADEIAAAVFVYRILTWLLPVPLGRYAFTRWRDETRASGDEDILDAIADAEDPEG